MWDSVYLDKEILFEKQLFIFIFQLFDIWNI